MSVSKGILYIKDVYPHWQFTKPNDAAILVIDQVLTTFLI